MGANTEEPQVTSTNEASEIISPLSHSKATKWLRPTVQAGFVIASVLVGVQFHRFVASLAADPSVPISLRPGGVDAFLPIRR